MPTEKFTSLGADVAELDAAWQDRLRDAEALLAGDRAGAAIASAVFCVEIRLKVLICKRLDLDRLPRAFEIHDLDALRLLAGLSRKLDDPSLSKVKLRWRYLKEYGEQLMSLRYRPDGAWSLAEAAKLVRYVKNPPHGVLPWLSTI